MFSQQSSLLFLGILPSLGLLFTTATISADEQDQSARLPEQTVSASSLQEKDPNQAAWMKWLENLLRKKGIGSCQMEQNDCDCEWRRKINGEMENGRIRCDETGRLIRIDFSDLSKLDGMPPLPNSVQEIYIDNNFEKLPNWPDALLTLGISCDPAKEKESYCPISLPPLPKSLRELNLSIPVSSLPDFPPSLERLSVWDHWKILASLPELSNSLSELRVDASVLTSLPALPGSLKTFELASDRMHHLPYLPEGLISMNVSAPLTELPQLPNSLRELDMTYTWLTTLPSLPPHLEWLSVTHNFLARLPTLPPSLKFLRVSHNHLPSLPQLPDQLMELETNDNELSELPDLPKTLLRLTASNNRLTSLPPLPPQLSHLTLEHNPLKKLPTLPHSLESIYVDKNLRRQIPTWYWQARQQEQDEIRRTDHYLRTHQGCSGRSCRRYRN